MRLNYGRTFTLGLGFFVISIFWSLYNSYMPVFYDKFVGSTFLVGLAMTFDNIAALTIQPYFGGLSDRTSTRFGRRMPFLLIGMPAAAVFFVFIPQVAVSASTIWPLLALTLLMNLFMSLYRTPTIALMPDITPSPLRSKANGIINFMGGLGALLVFFIGSMLYDIDVRMPFIVAAVIAFLVIIILYWRIKEPAEAAGSARETSGIIPSLFEVLVSKDKSALFMLMAVFCWFLGYAGIDALFTLYGKYALGIKESAASFSLGFLSLAFLIFAIPSGFLATRIGRKTTIMTGIVGLLAVFMGLIFIKELTLVRALLLLAGIFWSLININSYPMIAEMAPEGKVGAYTGLYYVFQNAAAIASPPTFGKIIDLAGNWSLLFVLSFIAFVGALIFMTLVKRGEAIVPSRNVAA